MARRMPRSSASIRRFETSQPDYGDERLRREAPDRFERSPDQWRAGVAGRRGGHLRGRPRYRRVRALSSALLMLRSANEDHPNGLANSSGLVGRNYIRHNNSVLMAVSRTPDPTRCLVEQEPTRSRPARPRLAGSRGGPRPSGGTRRSSTPTVWLGAAKRLGWTDRKRRRHERRS